MDDNKLCKYQGIPDKLLTTSVQLKQYFPNLTCAAGTLNNVLIDTGSSGTLANLQTIQKFDFFVEICPRVIIIQNAVQQHMARITKKCRCNIVIGNIETINCELLLVDDDTSLGYDMILGLDVINGLWDKLFTSRTFMNHFRFVQSIPRLRLNSFETVEVCEIIELENSDHQNCNFDCITEQCRNSKCSHKQYPAENSTHLTNTEKVLIDSNTEILIIVKTPTAQEFSLENTILKLNWRFENILQLNGFAMNQFDGFTVPVRIINTTNNDIIIPDNTDLICALPYDDGKIMYYEFNHLVEFRNLPTEERAFHQEEFDNWLENRNKIVNRTDISTKIENAMEKSECFKPELKIILNELNWVFSRNSGDIGLSIDYICELEFKDTYDGEPINKRPYPMDPELSLEVDEVLETMVNNDVIESCNSSYNTALLAVRKANGQIRLVQDYSRTINPHINLPNYPIANSRRTLNEISEHISHVKNTYGETTLISSLDLKSGFHIVPMRKSHRKYLAFKHRNKQFTFKRMSMGPKNSPSDFCCIMANVLNGLDTEKTKNLIYIDDVLILSAKSEALDGVRKVLKAFHDANMFINLDKCTFFYKQVQFLGYWITQSGFTAMKNKLQVIVDYPLPTTLKQAHAFTGITAYYSRYVPKLQILLAPLYNDINRKGKFKLSELAEKGIRKLQEDAKKGYHLEHIDWSKPVFICADTSLIGIGACMGNCTLTDDTVSDIQIAAYASRSLDLQESLLSSKAREVIGASWAFEAFGDLIHRNQPCYLITDHLSMTSVFSGNPLTSKTSIFTRFRRAVAVLLEYQITYIHLSAKHELVMVADGLSRNALYEKAPLTIRETDLGLNVRIIQDVSNALQVNSINTVTQEIEPGSLPAIPQPPLISKDDILHAQHSNTAIAEIRQKLSGMKPDEYYYSKNKQYCIRNDLVCIINRKNFACILVPAAMGYNVVQFLHHTKDHAAVDRLIFFINKLNIHIDSKYKTAQNVVSECYLCQLSKPKIEGKDAITYSLRPAVEPFQSIRADLLDFTHAEFQVCPYSNGHIFAVFGHLFFTGQKINIDRTRNCTVFR